MGDCAGIHRAGRAAISQTHLPIAWFPITMRNGQHLDIRLCFSIDHSKWESAQYKCTSSGFAGGPAFWVRDHLIESAIQFGCEIESRCFVALPVPQNCRFEFIKRFGVNL